MAVLRELFFVVCVRCTAFESDVVRFELDLFIIRSEFGSVVSERFESAPVEERPAPTYRFELLKELKSSRPKRLSVGRGLICDEGKIRWPKLRCLKSAREI